MARVRKINSNVSGARFSLEAALKLLPTTLAHQVWYPIEPNTYGDFGGQTTKTPRAPITASRQRKKGSTTDLDASGGIVQDFTQENMTRLFQGFLFANAREKPDTQGFGRERTFAPDGTEDAAPSNIAITNVDGTAEEFDAASGLDVFLVGHILLATNFAEAANNGLHVVTTVTSDTNVECSASNLVDETPTAAARLQAVGFQFASGDLDVDVDSGNSFPVINSSANAFLNLGLIPGEFIYIGGDTAATQFATSAMSGYARIRSVAADGSSITLDKTQQSWGTSDDAGTGKTIQIFFGTVIKNESDPDLIRQFSYQIERTLGKADDTLTGKQAEYLVGAVPNELTFNVQTADKATVDMSFVALDNETRNVNDAGVSAIKSEESGVSAPAIVEADAFNTSSDVKRIRFGTVSATDSFPDAFFSFSREVTITINNNVTPDKAVGVLGGFDVTVGDFQVGGNTTAYFQEVGAIQSVRDNDDITMDWHIYRSNAGISMDMPLLTLGDSRPNVEKDQPVLLPLTSEAATGAKVNSALDHTLLIVVFPYLPTVAAA